MHFVYYYSLVTQTVQALQYYMYFDAQNKIMPVYVDTQIMIDFIMMMGLQLQLRVCCITLSKGRFDNVMP